MQTQSNQFYRIIFLKKFTEEILLKITEEIQSRERIEVEKLKQKFKQESPDNAFKRIIRSSSKTSDFKEYQPSISHSEILIRHPMRRKMQIPRKMPLIKKPVQQIVEEKKPYLEIKPVPQPTPTGFNLGKIDVFIGDNTIQLIECPGPGKNILVKKYNQPNITKIILSQEEITSIINSFSKEARIPIVGGILKAAVGNFIISAVISEFVGSRFIINKITPFSMVAG